jgi:hypothetical protein
MPKLPIDYSNCCMYRIVCNDVNIPDCYVGHTTNLSKRKTQHKIDYKHKPNRYVYEFIRNNGGFDNWSVIEIEKYPCNSFNEALTRERYWIEYYKSSLNKVIPTRIPIEFSNLLPKDKYICKCGSTIQRRNLFDHENSKNHLHFLQNRMDIFSISTL